MFTGIIQHLGRVISVEPSQTGVTLSVNAQGWTCITQVSVGESIAVNGCCLTATSSQGLGFDVVPQTLRLTTLGELRAGDLINLERPVTPSTLMGGHILQGHVDGVGEVQEVTDNGAERRLRIVPPQLLMEFIIERGSIAVDGVSLTVAGVSSNWFEVALIPMTLRLTNLGTLRKNSRVNLECDHLAKIVVSWLKKRQAM